MADGTLLILERKTFTIPLAADVATLDAAIDAQIVTLLGNLCGTSKSAPAGDGVVMPGSILVVDYQVIVVGGSAEFTAQVQWDEYVDLSV